MRCPACGDEYEVGVLRCADCDVPLTDDAPGDDDLEVVANARAADARLGRFHPVVVERIEQLLAHRGVGYTVMPHDDEVEVRVDAAWRDDLRVEFAVSWPDLLRGLDDDAVAQLRRLGGAAPGWLDAPQGGYVDRTGRTVIAADDDDEDADEARVIGPALLTAGGIAIVAGWLLVSSPGLVAAGVALVVLGLVLPR